MHNVRAVAVVVNSPGGSAVQSSLIMKRIRKLREETKVPVVAFVEDVAASGGYYIACGADEIYADEVRADGSGYGFHATPSHRMCCVQSSVVGSIGVISGRFGLDKWINKFDIDYREQTAGSKKSQLGAFKPRSAEDEQHLQYILDGMHDNFKKAVKESRGERLKPDESADLFEGQFWCVTQRVALNTWFPTSDWQRNTHLDAVTGPRFVCVNKCRLADEAKRLGLIDGIGDMHTVLERKFGDVRLVEVNKGGLFNMFGGGGCDANAARGFFSKMSASADLRSASTDMVSGAMAAVEEDAVWKASGVMHR